MNRATIERVIQSLQLTPRFHHLNEQSIRVHVMNGYYGCSLGYEHVIEEMTEEQFVQHINARLQERLNRWNRKTRRSRR